jgi:hypothetical protein
VAIDDLEIFHDQLPEAFENGALLPDWVKNWGQTSK